MLGHLTDFLASDEFMPHGMCFLWRPELIWLHAVSDGVIALSYYSIPFTLIYVLMRRQDLIFPGVLVLFAAFILACGTTHLMGIWTLWHPRLLGGRRHQARHGDGVDASRPCCCGG